MDGGFTAKPLGMRQIDQAYPLVRAIAPDLPVERWRGFAEALIGASEGPGASAGIMTAQSDRGYIHGLFTYAAREDLRHGKVLSVDNFVVLDLFNLADAAFSLIRAMDTISRTLNCAAIHTILPDSYAEAGGGDRSVMGFFRDAGHHVDGARFYKALPGVGDNLSRPLTAVMDGA